MSLCYTLAEEQSLQCRMHRESIPKVIFACKHFSTLNTADLGGINFSDSYIFSSNKEPVALVNGWKEL